VAVVVSTITASCRYGYGLTDLADLKNVIDYCGSPDRQCDSGTDTGLKAGKGNTDLIAANGQVRGFVTSRFIGCRGPRNARIHVFDRDIRTRQQSAALVAYRPGNRRGGQLRGGNRNNH
jgi:hypothetical protein